jgi:hypothetical protein
MITTQRDRHFLYLLGGILFILLVYLFFAGAPDDETPLPRTSTSSRNEILRQLLSRVSAILRTHKIPHWLTFGTLKQWYERKHLDPKTYEIEMGILDNDSEKLPYILSSEMPGDTYVVHQEGDFGIQIVHKETGILVELIKYEDNKGILTQQNPNEWMRRMYAHHTKELKQEWIFPVKGDRIDGVDVPIPNRHDLLLKNWYA